MKTLFRFRYVIFFLSLSVLFWSIFRPEPPPKLFHESDKLFHVLAFFGFALITRFTFCRKTLWLVWLALLCSSLLLEYLQHVIQSHRHFSEQDALANLTGAVLAFIVWRLVIQPLRTDFSICSGTVINAPTRE